MEMRYMYHGIILLTMYIAYLLAVSHLGTLSLYYTETAPIPVMLIQEAYDDGLSEDEWDNLRLGGATGSFPMFDRSVHSDVGTYTQRDYLSCHGHSNLTTKMQIPKGSWLMGVRTKVVDGLGGWVTSFSVGDGVDTDLFGVQWDMTTGAQTSNRDATANWSNPQMRSSPITITLDGPCRFGSIMVSIYYRPDPDTIDWNDRYYH